MNSTGDLHGLQKLDARQVAARSNGNRPSGGLHGTTSDRITSTFRPVLLDAQRNPVRDGGGPATWIVLRPEVDYELPDPDVPRGVDQVAWIRALERHREYLDLTSDRLREDLSEPIRLLGGEATVEADALGSTKRADITVTREGRS